MDLLSSRHGSRRSRLAVRCVLVFAGWLAVSGLSFFIFRQAESPAVSLVLLALAGILLLVTKVTGAGLVDEVWADDEVLVVRKNGREARMDLLNVSRVEHARGGTTLRIALALHEPCAFGRTIVFIPPVRFTGLGTHPAVQDLTRRMEARRQAARAEGIDLPAPHGW